MAKSIVNKGKSNKEGEEYLVLVGRKIEARLLKKRITKSEFARSIGTSRSQVDRILTGDVNSAILQLRKICEVLEMSLSNLVKE